MGEPRFPPPHGQAGYREAGTADGPDGPRPPELEGPELPRGKRVIAKRPDDPDVALAKAFYPGRPRKQRVSRTGIILVAFLVIVWILFEFAMKIPPPRRRVSSPACSVQPC